ncbi:MAG: carbohydrate ABC transporter permease [Clostridiales bacterium]|nr:carbohydrate ABC transporter permease [Clostridiales bacterium]
MNQAKIKKETKNSIKVEFEDRTSRLERWKLKYLSFNFLGRVIFYILRFLLLLGISYVILYPFLTKITSSFMSLDDLVDSTVKLIPKYPTLDRYRMYITGYGYFRALFNTLFLSAALGLLQTFVCCFIGYGFAKYKFKGNRILFMLVVFTMIVPHNALQFAMYMKFRFFDIFGIIELIKGSAINTLNTFFPFIALSATGLAFQNGLYIFMMRQFFKGVPDELEESAYIDGSGVFRTFFTIILPLSVPMMVTIFLFAFSWQWTDYFYTNLFLPSGKTLLMGNFVASDLANATGQGAANLAAASLLIIAPLIIVYLFGQKYLIQGIERSGIVG